MADEKKEKDDLAYWLVVVNDRAGESPKCFRTETDEALVELVNRHVLDAKEEQYVFAFHGKRLQIAVPRPVSALRIGDKVMTIGEGDFQYDESGHIIPIRADKKSDQQS